MTDTEHADAPEPPVPAGLRRLIPSATLQRRIDDLAATICADHAGETVLLVSVLKGATLFLADLVRRFEPGSVEVDFMSISSYGGGAASSGVVRIEQDLEANLDGRHVIVVEDIVDTGLTLHYLLRVLRARNPASLDVCALLDKDVRRIVELPIRYRGFEIPDSFVIGYGLDFAQLYRNTTEIYAVDDVDALVARPDRFVDGLFGAG